MDTYKVKNKFSTGKTFTDGTLYNITEPTVEIQFPIFNGFKNNGYSDLINKLANIEKEKGVNSIIDKETIKYNSAEYGIGDLTNLKIKFIFYDGSNYGSDWVSAGFTSEEVSQKRNVLVKSFFKLDFYDSNDQNTKNFLFSEFFSVDLNNTPEFDLNRIFWLKNDPKFIEENTYRELFFDVTFFSAKDGKTRKFINKEITSIGSVSLTNYRDNKQWRFAKLRVLNPYNGNDLITTSENRLFYVEQPYNNNTDTQIIFSEIKF